MARGKKTEKVLTQEEKLAQALVPAEEQPYPVPENWLWLHGNNLFLPMETKRPRGDTFTYIDIDSIDNKLQTVSKPKVLPVSKAPSRASRALHIGDTLFSMVRPYLKNIAYIDESLSDAIASTGFYVCQPKENISPRFLYYLMTSPYVVDGLNKFMKGDNSPSIRKDDLQQFVYPVPPFAEQKRIVDCIESLFTKLDEAKAKAQAVVDGFETRKAAILHKAFTGELTAQWRKKRNISLDSWVLKQINEVCSPRAGYAFDSKKFTNSGYQIVRMGNLYGAELDLSRNPVFIAKDDVEENVLEKSLIHDGDILITLTGTKYKRDYGYAVCIVNPDGLLVNQRILCLSPLEDAEGNYIFYYLQSNIFRDIFFSNETGGVNQGNVSSKFVERIQIQIPTSDEQKEIVRILDSLLTREQQAKESAEAVLEQIDTIKKAILARAFRSELGTNDPAEESALELLKTVI